MWKFLTRKKRIHLDYAATTPVHSAVFSKMLPFFSDEWANPNAIYKEGVHVRKVIETSREELARTLKVRAQDITFTSGGTESNNLALIGIVESLYAEGKAYKEMEIISTKIEHPSILETLTYLEKRGVHISYVPVDEHGLIDLKAFEQMLNGRVVLVTFAYVNSEIGVVQEVKKITRIIRAWNETHTPKILTHTDASQAPLWLPCALDQLGVDLLTLDAGKCYGPKSMGVLAHRHWVKISPVLHGGGQEAGLRSGTENAALIIGGVTAIMRAQNNHAELSEKITKLREYFFELLSNIPKVIINGSSEHRVANNINISIPGLNSEYAVIWLDTKGIAAATRSACGSGEGMGSDVVREISHDEARATSTLRFTLGEKTTKSDIETAFKVLKEHINFMQKN